MVDKRGRSHPAVLLSSFISLAGLVVALIGLGLLDDGVGRSLSIVLLIGSMIALLVAMCRPRWIVRTESGEDS